MSQLSTALLSGIDLGGRQSNQALEMALAIDGQKRRSVLQDLQIADEQRRAQYQREDRPAAVSTRDLHLGDLEAENQARVEALASKHADQRYHAWDAERMGMFNSPDPETGDHVGAPHAYTQFHAMDPSTQAAAVAAQRGTVQKQEDWKARERIAQVKQSFHERDIQNKVGQIWSANKQGLIDDGERDRRLDELETTGHVSATRFAHHEDPQALHDQVVAAGGSEEQAKAAALQSIAKRGGASPQLFNLPKVGNGVMMTPEDLEANRSSLSPRVQAMLEPYVSQGRPVPTTIMAMAYKPDKGWNESERDVARSETLVRDADDRYKLALKGFDKTLTPGSKAYKAMMDPILAARNAKQSAEVARDAAHDAAQKSHTWKPPVKAGPAAPSAPMGPPAPGPGAAAPSSPDVEGLRRSVFNQALKEAGDGASDEEVQGAFERLWKEAQRGDER